MILVFFPSLSTYYIPILFFGLFILSTLRVFIYFCQVKANPNLIINKVIDIFDKVILSFRSCKYFFLPDLWKSCF